MPPRSQHLERLRAAAVLVLEDQAPVRAWLVDLVRTSLGCSNVLQAARIAEAQALVAAAPAIGLSLVDLQLPDGNGVEVIASLRTRHPDALVVVTTVFDDDEHVFPAIAAGAHGYLLKEQDPAQLVQQLLRILDGEPPLSPSVARSIVAFFHRTPEAARLQHSLPPASQPQVALTPRETETLSLIGRGLRTSEVARVLGLSQHTVAGYLKDIYRKLDISSRAEAALEASRRGLT